MISLVKLLPDLIKLFFLILNSIKEVSDTLDRKKKIEEIRKAIDESQKGDTSSIEHVINK